MPSDPTQPEGPKGLAVMTITVLAVLAGAFVVEVIASTAARPGLLLEDPQEWRFGTYTLLSLGGLSKTLVVKDGQWWRLLTAPLLHGGPVHILLNGLAMAIMGARLERLVGPAWLLGIFAGSAICGGLSSLVLNPEWVVSVGASGGIMGLFAAAAVVSFHLETSSKARADLRDDALRVMLPTLIPALLIPSSGGAQNGIDVAAHLGGALAGLAFGALLLGRWGDLGGTR